MSRTLFIGHSLVGQVVPTMFNDFMDSQSIDNHADAQVTNGAPLSYNWDNGASAQGVNAREVLPSGDYDTVIVTEAIPLDTQIQYNDTHGYAESYFNLAQSADADTRFYVYETWHALGADTQEWRAQIESDLPAWQGIVDHVNDNAAEGAQEAFIIPAGQAMAELHDRIEAGEVPGVTSIRELFSDDIHLNDTGSWFIAALHASAVTGLDPSALPLETFDDWGTPYGGPDAALAEVLADVIDVTLDEFLPQDQEPLSGESGDTDVPEDTNDDAPNEDVWNDDLIGNAGNVQLAGGTGDDILRGGNGNDTLYGGDGSDALTGGAGNDIIIGDGGDDILTLGDGADTVSGGDGDDVFVLTGLPGSVMITDFGANGAQDMIDLSAIDGYESFADVAEATSFSGPNTVLTFAVPDGVLTVTVRSDDPLSGDDFVLSANSNEPTEIVPPVDPVGPIAPSGLTFTIEGADSHHFVVDPETGDIGNQSWFTPSHDQIWDVSGDRIYEVERVGSNANGEEVSHIFFELETTPDDVVWREVDGENDTVEPVGPIDDGRTFFLEGPDAYHFVIDPESGEVGNVSWFDPSFDQVWDTNGDRVYETERYALAEDGTEVSREALEMETTPDGVVWRVVSSSEEGEMSGAQIMSALALPPAEEKDLPEELEDSDDAVPLPI